LKAQPQVTACEFLWSFPTINELLGTLAPGQAGELITDAIDRIAETGATAGLVAIVGLLVAFWSASGYLSAFLRTLNAIHGIPANRARTGSLLRQLGLTAIVGLLLVVCVFLVIFTGDVARRMGEAIGIGSAGVTAWSIAKWPVLLALVAAVISLLYRAGPHAEHRPRWISPGGLTAVLVWIVVSALFGVYLSTLASYERTYGALSSVIIFLIWLWLTNLAVLFGAELDAELDRSRNEPGGAIRG
jgi:membrane protein